MGATATETTTTEAMANAFDAINHYLEGHVENAAYMREGVYAIGENLHVLKNEYPDTKAFGAALETNCPLLPVKMVSYYIKASGHGTGENVVDVVLIERIVTAHAPLAVNPRTIWDTVQKVQKLGRYEEKNADDESGEVEKIELTVDEKLTTMVNNLENFINGNLVNMHDYKTTADKLAELANILNSINA